MSKRQHLEADFDQRFETLMAERVPVQDDYRHGESSIDAESSVDADYSSVINDFKRISKRGWKHYSTVFTGTFAAMLGISYISKPSFMLESEDLEELFEDSDSSDDEDEPTEIKSVKRESVDKKVSHKKALFYSALISAIITFVYYYAREKYDQRE